MRAFLIEPKNKSITEIETDGELDDLYKLIDCHLIDVVILNDEEDVLYLDDEGLSRSPNSYFKLSLAPNPFAGRAVVLGTDMDGGPISPKTATLESLEASVTFISGETAVVMAEKADAAAQKHIDGLDDGWTHIHIPIADIIRAAVYTGESEGAE